MIGDGHVVVAERVARLDHRLEGVTAVAIGRVHVEVAADLGRIDQRGKGARRCRLDLSGSVPKFGGDVREAEAGIERVLTGVWRISETAAMQLEEVSVGAGGATENRAVVIGRSQQYFDRDAAMRACDAPVSSRRDRGQKPALGDRSARGGRILRPADENERRHERLNSPEVSGDIERLEVRARAR